MTSTCLRDAFCSGGILCGAAICVKVVLRRLNRYVNGYTMRASMMQES